MRAGRPEGLRYTSGMLTHAAGVVFVAVLVGSLPLRAQTPTFKPSPREGTVKQVARGTFDVKLTPTPASDDPARADLGRMTIDKLFHGDLEGTSKGEMLTAGTATKGSAGYVAIERVTGTLQGRKGSFILQHTATMNRGTPQLNIIVLPDSGTEQLAGIAGMMTIKIDQGQHFYEFDYTFNDAK